MTLAAGERQSIIWATRGRTWGFRFLLNAGLRDPLATYERAFVGLDGSDRVWERRDEVIAWRLPDPLGRRDESGRVVPHDFVLLGPLATQTSGDTALTAIWSRLADGYAEIWDSKTPPSAERLSGLF